MAMLIILPNEKNWDVDNFLYFHWLNLHTWTPYDFFKLALKLVRTPLNNLLRGF